MHCSQRIANLEAQPPRSSAPLPISSPRSTPIAAASSALTSSRLGKSFACFRFVLLRPFVSVGSCTAALQLNSAAAIAARKNKMSILLTSRRHAARRRLGRKLQMELARKRRCSASQQAASGGSAEGLRARASETARASANSREPEITSLSSPALPPGAYVRAAQSRPPASTRNAPPPASHSRPSAESLDARPPTSSGHWSRESLMVAGIILSLVGIFVVAILVPAQHDHYR